MCVVNSRLTNRYSRPERGVLDYHRMDNILSRQFGIANPAILVAFVIIRRITKNMTGGMLSVTGS